MNKLTLKIKAVQKGTFVYVDDKQQTYKKDRFSNRIYTLFTEKKQISLKIYKYQDLNTKYWWLYEIMYFFLSIFGLFDIKGKQNYYVIKYEALIDLNEETNVDLAYDYKAGQAFKQIKTNTELHEVQNQKQISKQAKKRSKIVLWSRIAVWVVLAIVVGIIIGTQL